MAANLTLNGTMCSVCCLVNLSVMLFTVCAVQSPEITTSLFSDDGYNLPITLHRMGDEHSCTYTASSQKDMGILQTGKARTYNAIDINGNIAVLKLGIVTPTLLRRDSGIPKLKLQGESISHVGNASQPDNLRYLHVYLNNGGHFILEYTFLAYAEAENSFRFKVHPKYEINRVCTVADTPESFGTFVQISPQNQLSSGTFDAIYTQVRVCTFEDTPTGLLEQPVHILKTFENGRLKYFVPKDERSLFSKSPVFLYTFSKNQVLQEAIFIGSLELGQRIDGTFSFETKISNIYIEEKIFLLTSGFDHSEFESFGGINVLSLGGNKHRFSKCPAMDIHERRKDGELVLVDSYGPIISNGDSPNYKFKVLGVPASREGFFQTNRCRLTMLLRQEISVDVKFESFESTGNGKGIVHFIQDPARVGDTIPELTPNEGLLLLYFGIHLQWRVLVDIMPGFEIGDNNVLKFTPLSTPKDTLSNAMTNTPGSFEGLLYKRVDKDKNLKKDSEFRVISYDAATREFEVLKISGK